MGKDVKKLGLRALSGPDTGRSFELQTGKNMLGRSLNIAVPINDLGVSRNHAEIRFQNDCFLLHDLGSTNGTYINEKRLQKACALLPGDHVRLGSTVFMVERMSYYADHPASVAIKATRRLIPTQSVDRGFVTPRDQKRETSFAGSASQQGTSMRDFLRLAICAVLFFWIGTYLFSSKEKLAAKPVAHSASKRSVTAVEVPRVTQEAPIPARAEPIAVAQNSVQNTPQKLNIDQNIGPNATPESLAPEANQAIDVAAPVEVSPPVAAEAPMNNEDNEQAATPQIPPQQNQQQINQPQQSLDANGVALDGNGGAVDANGVALRPEAGHDMNPENQSNNQPNGQPNNTETATVSD